MLYSKCLSPCRLKIPLAFMNTLPTPAVSTPSFFAASNVPPCNNANLRSLGNNANLPSLGSNTNLPSLGNSAPMSAFPATSSVLPYSNANVTRSNSTSTTAATAGPTVNINSEVSIPPVLDSSLPEALQAAPYPIGMFGSMFNKYPDDDVLDPHVFGYGTTQPGIKWVALFSNSAEKFCFL